MKNSVNDTVQNKSRQRVLKSIFTRKEDGKLGMTEATDAK